MKQFLSLLILISTAAYSQTSRTAAFAISTDGVQIAYDVYAGNASTALVFVHGWSCDRAYWTGQAGPFSKKYKVVTIDLAGHGGSGLSRKEYTMESFGADVAAVVNKLALEKVILVGHSMGGDVIAEAARQLNIQSDGAGPKNKVAALIMVDTYKKLGAGRTPEEVESVVTRLRTHFKDSAKVLVRGMFLPTSDPKLVEYVSDDMSSAPPAVALSAVHHALSYSRQMPATLQELKLPVVMINPDNSPTDMASMKKYGVKVEVQKGVGHFLMMEDAKGFNTILGRLLSGL